MLWSHLQIATLREPVHPLLMRAGYKRGAEYLALGQRALAKIEEILSNEPDRARALTRCGVLYIRAGNCFVAESEAGDQMLVRGADYAALMDEAMSVPLPPQADTDETAPPDEFATPGVKTIAQIAEFTGLPVTSQMKSLVMWADGTLILALLRGDHQLSEAKFAALFHAKNLRPASAEEIRAHFGADAGSLGPVGAHGLRIVADEALRGRSNMISGANKNDFHLRHVTPVRDFACGFADLRRVNEGDTCVNGGPLTFHSARLLDSAESILESVVEQNHDDDGMILPVSIAPFQVIVTPVHPLHLETGLKLQQDLLEAGIDCLLDDRDARPGVKFKDADLLGIPYRVNLGKKLAEGLVEVVERGSKRMQDVALNEVTVFLRASLANG